MRLSARPLPYSSTVGGGVQLLDAHGRPRFMVAFIGMQDGITKEESVTLSEQFVHYVNNHDVVVPVRK